MGSEELIWEGTTGVVAAGNESKVHLIPYSIVSAELMFLLSCGAFIWRLSLLLLCWFECFRMEYSSIPCCYSH